MVYNIISIRIPSNLIGPETPDQSLIGHLRVIGQFPEPIKNLSWIQILLAQ